MYTSRRHPRPSKTASWESSSDCMLPGCSSQQPRGRPGRCAEWVMGASVDGCDDAGLPQTGPIPMYRRFVDGQWFWPAMFCTLCTVSYTRCSLPSHVIGAPDIPQAASFPTASLARALQLLTAALAALACPRCSQKRRERARCLCTASPVRACSRARRSPALISTI